MVHRASAYCFRVFHVVIRKLLGFSFLGPGIDTACTLDAAEGDSNGRCQHDLDGCLYYFRLLSDIMSCSTGRTWAILANEILPIEVPGAQLLKDSKQYRPF